MAQEISKGGRDFLLALVNRKIDLLARTENPWNNFLPFAVNENATHEEQDTAYLIAMYV